VEPAIGVGGKGLGGQTMADFVPGWRVSGHVQGFGMTQKASFKT